MYKSMSYLDVILRRLSAAKELENGCILATNTQGDVVHGHVLVDPQDRKGKDLPSTLHRALLYLTQGPPPYKGAFSVRTCGTRWCINPKHMMWRVAQGRA